MKAAVHPGEFVYIYPDSGDGNSQVPFSVLVIICHSSSLVVPEPSIHIGFAYITVRFGKNGQLEYCYEYADSKFNQVTKTLARLENKDREQILTHSFIKQTDE